MLEGSDPKLVSGAPGSRRLRGRILDSMTRTAAARRSLPTSPFRAQPVAPIENFELGDRVSHDRFGLGRVIGVEEGIAVLVDFGSQQMRCLSPFTKLVKL